MLIYMLHDVAEFLLYFSLWNQVKARRRLTKSVLSERVKVLDDHQTDSVFHGFRPVASSADRLVFNVIFSFMFRFLKSKIGFSFAQDLSH